ncbi:MAG: DoxX family membrane protein [Saprospiraceae bacterium]|nr:DoxX family membrane protein [Saprospiraceae bacterium]
MINFKHISGLTLLRFAVGIIFISHAVARIQLGTVGGFGGFLDAQGFSPLGFYLAWGITCYELLGGALLLSGRALKWVCLIFVVHQLGGITMVHFKQGWFVVGSGQGGMEYSFLLIFSLLAIAFSNSFRKAE